MLEILSFPGLGLEFAMNPVAFHIGSWPVRWYGILFACSAVMGMLYVFRRVKLFGLDADRMTDVLLGCILCGLIGARLYYVVFRWSDFAGNPMQIFRVWEGGIAIYGGIIGAIWGAVVLCKRFRVRFLPALDVGLTGLILAQAIGRWGNFVNMEAFGSNTTLPWGMTSPTIARYLTYAQPELAAAGVIVDPSMPVHPTFFYESIWCLLGFCALAWYTTRRRFDGELSLLYLFWYGLGRFFIEGLRTDSLMLGPVRISQALALLCVVISGLVCKGVRSRMQREGGPEFRLLYVDTEEGQAVVAGTFYPQKKKAGKPEPAAVPEEVTLQEEEGAALPNTESGEEAADFPETDSTENKQED